MANRTITAVKVYWDTQDSSNEGWAYRASDAIGLIDTGAIDGVADDDLDGAIAEAIQSLDIDVSADQFAREPHLNGGYATWSA